MKKLTLIIILILSQLLIIAQCDESCLPEGITFNTQEEIDNFQTNYPNCTEIEGCVFISDQIFGGNITNLNGLNVITSIGGELTITGNDNLINLSGLENLISIGGKLKIGDPYSWGGNNSLTSLSGLDNLTSIGEDMIIYGNSSLTSLTGLNNVASIGGNLRIENNDFLISLTGLGNVASIGGSLSISHSYSLTNLTGLENVVSIGGWLSISQNYSLTSLTGLDNIDAGSINNLYIQNNNSLSTCDAQSVCDYLASPNGSISIHDNTSGCNSQAQVEAACEANHCLPEGITFTSQAQIDGFQANYPSCIEIEGDVMINGDDITNLIGLNVLTSIGGYLWITNNNSLNCLSGLENIDAGSISDLYITYNPVLSTCNVLSVCDYLASPNGVIEIHDNAPGCNSQAEVQEVCEAHCLPEGITFYTQVQIDNFQTNYPNCTVIEGNVIIQGNNITNLDELIVLYQFNIKPAIIFCTFAVWGNVQLYQ